MRDRAGWRAGLIALAGALVLAALATAPLVAWGVDAGRLEWSLGVEGLIGRGLPALAAIALGLALAAAAWAALSPRRRGSVAALLVAVCAAMVLAAWGATEAAAARTALRAPPVHDVATDWRDPLMPTPALLAARGPPAFQIEAAPSVAEGPRMAVLGRPVAEVNRTTCPAAAPVVLTVTPADAFARLKAATARDGLSPVTDDPGRGVLEAIGRIPLLDGARADLLARVQPAGAGARVDLRSVSRFGRTDGEANCRRVTRLRAALARS